MPKRPIAPPKGAPKPQTPSTELAPALGGPQDPHEAATGLQPMLTPQVPVMPKSAPSPGSQGGVLFELLGLSPRASDLVRRMGLSNKLSNREVIARIVEQWAAARKD